MSIIVGRKAELAALEKIKRSDKSEFVAVYGRRRIGKTFLIREAFQNSFDFYLTGTANAPLKQQLTNFHRALQKYAPGKAETKPPKDWFTAFHKLEAVLESKKTGKKIIFLDELPWLDTRNSNFIPALEYFWNSYVSSKKDIILVVCGSAASWMMKKLIHSRGGFHNRVTLRLRLEPFTLAECEAFFKNRYAAFTRYQIVQLYMVLGGVPFYLDMVDVGLSATQNINKLCFTTNASLIDEFDDLYRSLFADNADKHISIIEALEKKAKGLTRMELLTATRLPNAGSTTRILKELEESGFIKKYPPFAKKDKNALYQLIDFYSLFYLKFIRNNTILDDDAWMVGLDSPQQRAWSGYAFEQVCIAHIKQIKQALGISGIQTAYSSWISEDSRSKAQIDLLIDRRDNVINICEIKFSVKEFTIDKKYHDELRRKMELFREESGTRKSLYLTMLTSFGLKQNQYSNSIVQNQLSMDSLF